MSQKKRPTGQAIQQEEIAEESEQLVPVSQELDNRVYALLGEMFPRSEPLSVLLLHVSQLEQPQAGGWRRRRVQAPANLLEQVMANIQRVIRTDDRIVVQKGVGAALIFPQVDQQGIYHILERIYASVSLLQAETIVPPLTRETTILLGIGSYPETAASPEMLLQHMRNVARCLVLRPAITTQLRGVKPVPSRETGPVRSAGEELPDRTYPGVPFMELPKTLPARLVQLIPCSLARELRCVPVGRDHHCLTVALANPLNAKHVLRLREVTGMLIFPVSCEEKDLDELLATGW